MARSTIDSAARALSRIRGIDEWIVGERRSQRAHRLRDLSSLSDEVATQLDLYRDLRRGRGSASSAVTGEDHIRSLIRAASERATRNIGPPWQLPRPAAPARVTVADDELYRDPAAVADTLLGEVETTLARLGGAMTAQSIEVVTAATEHEVRTSTGFASRYRETEIGLRMVLRNRDSVWRVGLTARRAADLDLAGAIDRAGVILGDRARAAHPSPGRYDLVLIGDALVGPSARGPGIWLPLVSQADAATARRGLRRYREGQTLYQKEPVGDLLTISSDGTRAFAPLSAPFGERGEPVRRFDLVRGGVAAGLALDVVEAGRRGVTPNGGVRNLVLAPGPTPAAALLRGVDRRPILELSELTSLDIDPQTGDFTGEIGLGSVSVRDRRQPVAGGAVRGNLFGLLTAVRFAAETEQRGWYHGPTAIRFDDVEVVT